MSVTTIEISKEKKKIIAMGGYTIKGVFERGFNKLFIDPMSSADQKIKALSDTLDMAKRTLARMQTRIVQLEEENEKRRLECLDLAKRKK